MVDYPETLIPGNTISYYFICIDIYRIVLVLNNTVLSDATNENYSVSFVQRHFTGGSITISPELPFMLDDGEV